MLGAPEALEAVTRALASGAADPAEAVARVDRFVTSRVGFRQMRGDGDRGDVWDEARLVEALCAAVGQREAALTVAARAVDVGRLIRLADGPDRRALIAQLEKTAAVSVGPSPYRPVGVPLTKHAQEQVELPVMGGVEVRAVDINPDADDTLLLVHGHGARIEEYEQLIDATLDIAGDAARVIVFDLPGCGYSDKPRAAYSIAAYETVLISFVEALGVSRCVVAGGGLGGNLTLRLALHHPQIVRGAVAWSVAGWGEKRRLLSWGARALASAPPCVFWKVVGRQVPEQFSTDFDDRDRLIAADLSYRREVYEPGYHDAYFHIAADQVGTSMLARAHEIEPPVTLLAGAEDEGPLGIPGAVQRLAEVMGVEAHLLEGGYALNHERPDELAGYLRAALATR